MRTASSSSRQLWGEGLPQCTLGYTPHGVGLETPRVWAWRLPRCGPGDLPQVWPRDAPGQTPQPPPGCGPGDLPRPDPSTSPPGCWPGDPRPQSDPWSSPLGVCLETCKACWDTPPPPGDLQGMLGYHLQGMLGYHLQGMMGYHPPVNRITDTCKNIKLPQLRFGR